MSKAHGPIAPGAHIVVRDAVWRVQQVNHTSNGTHAWHVVGVSEIVRDQEAIFLEEYEPAVEVLDPRSTRIELDRSPGHRDSLLYLEALLRDVPPTGPELHIGHRAAMDALEFQLAPARLALGRLRQRILIADAVGLGKTLQAGILVAELIARGRGKRILVATTRSMLTQFQKEFWCRFAIPLVRLDSVGLQRIRERIPTSHNPFHHYDRAIVSIDTLKQHNAFRAHVEQAWWDIVIIDEAHNVARRAGGRSLRAGIAQVLARRCDALLLLSATPHDGRARSFASLIELLDPTAIANPDDYGRDEIEGLFVRRFKRDVQAELGREFPEPQIDCVHARATPAEERAFDLLAGLTFTRIDRQVHAGMLFRTTLEKALLSSPAACLETIEHRIKRLAGRPDAAEFRADIEALRAVAEAVRAIDAGSHSKYDRLVELVRDDFGWTPERRDDRLVIFSERIETLRYLRELLPADLGLLPEQLALLHGGLPDTEQQSIVEVFGQAASPLRLLLASDVAAEGLNLHYQCHKLIHFDVPWSLMTIQQRNGRIDRYGQPRTPLVRYLLTDCANEKVRGDQRILELLVERDEQARKNIGDPSALMGLYEVEAEERFTAGAIEAGRSAEQFDELLGHGEKVDWLAALFGDAPAKPPSPQPKEPLRLFDSDFDYLAALLARLRESERLEHTIDREERLIELPLPADTAEARRERAPGLDLRRRFRQLPDEVLPEDGVLLLSPDTARMQQAMELARREERAWPRLHFLWPLAPVMRWAGDRARALFERHTAPVLTLLDGLDTDEAVVVVSALIPNRRGQPILHRWYAACFRDGQFDRLEDFGELCRRIGLGRRELPNRQAPLDEPALRALIERAVEQTREAMLQRRASLEQLINARLTVELDRLESLRDRQLAEIERRFSGQEREQQARRAKSTFDQYLEWVEDALCSEPEPFLLVVALLRPEPPR